MQRLAIQLLGELTVAESGQPISLPASRKTRALLAYLVMTGRPHRRDRLCEMFWEIPDDPRGALRWSLSKLRSVVNRDNRQQLIADRERVSFDRERVVIDLDSLNTALHDDQVPLSTLIEFSDASKDTLLDGIDLPNQPLFQHWLTAEREEYSKARAQLLRRIAMHPALADDQRLRSGADWLEADPFNSEAAAWQIANLHRYGENDQAEALNTAATQRFAKANIAWPIATPDTPAPPESPAATRRQMVNRQTIQFCSAEDQVRIAYASVGNGSPLVKAANWLSHLELDWDAPIWSPLFRELAQYHRLIRYDERGNGLSDWSVDDISFDAFVADLETVVDALALERFALLGISQGASVSIEYAVRHPERVSHLILFGGYAAGWRIDATPETIREREAVMTLTETGWGQDNPAYRQIFSSTFLPTASPEDLAWFNEFQRRTASPTNAARFLSAFGDIDVRDRLADVGVPTLVMHSLGDRRVPVTSGRDIAASIPGAEFIGLESDGHLLLGDEPASGAFIAAVRDFIAR